MRVRFSRLGSFRRTFTLDIIDTNVWRHYDIVISDVGQVDIYIDKILQTYLATGANISVLRLFTSDNSTTNLLQIYSSICLLADLKIVLKSTLEETKIDDLTFSMENSLLEYLMYDNTDTSGNGKYFVGTITEQGRDLYGKPYFRLGDLSAFVIDGPPNTVDISSTSGGPGLTMSFDINLFQTGTSSGNVVFGIGTLISDRSYNSGSTNTTASGFNMRILKINSFQFLFCDPSGTFNNFFTPTNAF